MPQSSPKGKTGYIPFCKDNRLSLKSRISVRRPEAKGGAPSLRDVYLCKNCQNKFSVDTRSKK